MNILLTSTSFQDTYGLHHDALKATGFKIDYIRGPVNEDVLMPIIANYDGVICGDDNFTKEVLEKGRSGKLKIISKYGIGLDKIDINTAKRLNIKVFNCPGVNHFAVAEHVFSLLLAFYKNIVHEINITKKGKWDRLIGHEIHGKRIGVVGMGRIGKQLLIISKSFGLKLFAFDKNIDVKVAKSLNVEICQDLPSIFSKVDIISLNMNLTNENKYCINETLIKEHTKKGLLLINTARGELIQEEAIIMGLKKNILSGYLTDVMISEPMKKDHPFIKNSKILITPHIGSRTYQTVQRQGLKSIENLVNNI